MYLDPAAYRSAGMELGLGQRVRIGHDCGPGDVLIVSRDEQGIRAYCHRCHESGRIKDEVSLATRLARLAEARSADAAARMAAEPPLPAVYDVRKWPRDARLWLYKAGFSNDDIEALGFYWHERMQRVILPVYKDGAPVYWQARSFTPGLPKALNADVPKHGLVAKYGTPAGCIALTEDILSAAKVAKVTEAWALLGTSLDDPTALALAQRGLPVLLMLDSDAAGRRGAAAAAKKLSLLGVQTRQVYFGHDPKLEFIEGIRECISTSSCPLGP